MILEIRTYDLLPGRSQKVLDKIGAALPERVRLSPLAAMWNVEVGQLDRIIHFWPWTDLAQRTEVRARFSELNNWPVRNDDDIVSSDSWIMRPAPFTPPLAKAALGPVYEICIDRMKPHALDKILSAWEPMIEKRSELAPFVGAWSSIIGPLNTWVHVWGYESLEHRREVTAEAVSKGVWPPAASPDTLFTQRTVSLARPASYSLLS